MAGPKVNVSGIFIETAVQIVATAVANLVIQLVHTAADKLFPDDDEHTWVNFVPFVLDNEPPPDDGARHSEEFRENVSDTVEVNEEVQAEEVQVEEEAAVEEVDLDIVMEELALHIGQFGEQVRLTDARQKAGKPILSVGTRKILLSLAEGFEDLAKYVRGEMRDHLRTIINQIDAACYDPIGAKQLVHALFHRFRSEGFIM